MSIEITLLAQSPYIELLKDLIGWAGWSAMFVLLVLLLWQWRGYNKRWTNTAPGLRWGIFAGLLVLVPLTSLFLVVRLPAGDALSPPGVFQDPRGPALILLVALPWVLAGGLLGVYPATILALLSGVILAFWDTHSLFTPLEFAILAATLAVCIQQRNRTRSFRWLTHPLVAILILILIYPVIFLGEMLCVVNGTLASRLDFALSRVGFSWAATGVVLLVAAVIAEGVALAWPRQWGGTGPLQPSPIERRLQTRFLYSLAPLALLLVASLMVGNWVVAGNAAQQMLQDRMASTARMAADIVPFFLGAGQNYIKQLADDPRLYVGTPTATELSELLAQDILTVPFFNQLFLLNTEGEYKAGYLGKDVISVTLSEKELIGAELALNGVVIQFQTIPPVLQGETAVVSFIALVRDEDQQPQGILVGRSDLVSNPLTQPIISSLKSMNDTDGQGMLLDADGNVLFDSKYAGLMEKYTGRTAEAPLFYDDAAPDGTRQLVYYRPAVGHPWAIVLSIPARQSQQLALTIAAPLLIMTLVLFVLTVVLINLGLRVVTASLQNLALGAIRISSGQLDHALTVEGDDEVGQTRRAFEQMRVSLKARLDELNRLLLASQGVASSLEIEEAVKPLLEAALATGASAARVALDSGAVPGMPGEVLPPRHFGAGPSCDVYTSLDDQILALTRQQDRVVLTNLGRVRLLNFAPGMPRPEAVLALALRHESLYFGTLWLAYEQPHQFTEDELRFLITLSGQAALAAANARLFLSAEIGRQRLAAILASTPDPVLVTDHQNCLLLANPAAWQVVGLGVESGIGELVDTVIPQKELVKLLRSIADQKQSAEVTMADSRVYLATASSVMAEGRRVGRVCVMRDITHFKELDALKSEFVATVSHDLRSPLTLMRGYATMLEMVGNLNEQQTGYVRKIVSSVETMSRLVNNLLDLGRIEAGVDLQLEMVPIHDIVERVTGALQLQATQKRIQITVEMPPHTIPLVEADQALLQQALHNLVENAIKYTEPGGKVAVRVQARQDMMVFEVSDSGIGISPVDIPRLFEKFYRGAQREAKKQVGTGLGLAIVKSIAERHKGQVWVESQLGKGSTFSLAIPLRQPKREPPKPK